jgi:regulator of cell morphogenesis and NO signaling
MITAQTKVADVAAESLAAIRVFQKHGIDFCCGGQRPIADVCKTKGMEPESLVSELEAALTGPVPDSTDWNRSTLKGLIGHIVVRHHEYLRSELPRIQVWLDKVYSKYAVQDADTIGRLPAIFTALRTELEGHLRKEEMILFPSIIRFEAALDAGLPAPPLPFGSFAGPIGMMEHEHESAGEALRQLRESTNQYTPPEHACRTYRALFEALGELESDLHMHIHLENNILHARVRDLAGLR